MPAIDPIKLRTSLIEELKKNFDSEDSIEHKMSQHEITKDDILNFFDKYPHYFYFYHDNRYKPVAFIHFLSMESTIEMIKSYKEKQIRARAKADNKPLVRRLLNSLLDGSVTSIQEKMDEHEITRDDVLDFFEELPHFFYFNERASLIYLLTEASPEELVQQANKNLEGVALKTDKMAGSMMELIQGHTQRKRYAMEQEKARIQAANAKRGHEKVSQCTVGMPCNNPFLIGRSGGKSKKYRKKSKKSRKKSRKSRKKRFPHKKSKNKKK